MRKSSFTAKMPWLMVPGPFLGFTRMGGSGALFTKGSLVLHRLQGYLGLRGDTRMPGLDRLASRTGWQRWCRNVTA